MEDNEQGRRQDGMDGSIYLFVKNVVKEIEFAWLLLRLTQRELFQPRSQGCHGLTREEGQAAGNPDAAAVNENPGQKCSKLEEDERGGRVEFQAILVGFLFCSRFRCQYMIHVVQEHDSVYCILFFVPA